MTSKKSKKRLFCGMSYREVQRSNSIRKSHLPKQNQQWLKENGYRNVGWDSIIRLYQKINELLSSTSDELTLEELFLKAEQIGNKYQAFEEIEAFNQALKAEVEAISNEIDKRFPDEEFEFTDYGKKSYSSGKRKVTQNRQK